MGSTPVGRAFLPSTQRLCHVTPKAHMSRRQSGTVYLVGAGPGDPGLLTVRGQELLRRADVVAFDHLVSPAIVDSCRADAERIYVGKEPSRHTASQTSINRLLIRAAKAGKMVVRLKGGDPYLFGRGGEEALELAKAGLRFEIVPGVTSALAAPAYAGIPATFRETSSSVAVVTGHEDPAKPQSAIRWDRLATATDTLIVLMGVGTLAQTAGKLIEHGRPGTTPAALVEWGTLPRQRTVTATLGTIAARAQDAGIRPPSVLLVGQVVELRRKLNWFEARPLFGRRILVTRAADKAGAFARQLEGLGAAVEQLPAIELTPVKPNGVFRDAVRDLPQTDWVFFTSPEGLGWFAKLLKPYRKDLRSLSGCHIGAIGPKTAMAIEASGLHVDFVPKRFSQEGMLDGFPRRVLTGKRALILSAEGSRDVLEDGLRRRGARVRKIPIYRTVVPKTLEEKAGTLARQPFDYVTVTSASCVDHLAAAFSGAGHAGAFRRLPFASIGPVTSAAVRSKGGRVLVEARVSTIEGLTEAIRRHVRAA